MSDDSPAPDVSIDRTGDVPKRTDNRTVLHMFHDELGKALGIGQATDRKVNVGGGKSSGLMDAVNSAVTGAPGPGSEEY